ncbi:MAG: hypothetical protein MI919_29765 [Holophagales bacterium]|nr:hypothetical protein [Holophagales bacterium]
MSSPSRNDERNEEQNGADTPPEATPDRLDDDRRLDIYRRGGHVLCVARSGGRGSLGLLFSGVLDGAEGRDLGSRVLGWLAEAEAMPDPAERLTYPYDLLPGGWDVQSWRDFMAEASLCGLVRLGKAKLRLRPYKNLHPVGEEFSHEGGHALDCSPSHDAVGAAARAALEVSHAISQVRRAPHHTSGAPRLTSRVLDQLTRLGARLFDRPPRPEVVEVTEGFFVLPAPLRQLLFDVVWRRSSRLVRRSDGRRFEVEWYPITDITPLRTYPLMRVASDGDARVLVRLDTASPADPPVFLLEATDLRDPSRVLGPADGVTTEPPDGDAPEDGLAQAPRLSDFLAGLDLA